jgi:hypothetical protein
VYATQKEQLCHKNWAYYVDEYIWGSKPVGLVVFKQLVWPQVKETEMLW